MKKFLTLILLLTFITSLASCSAPDPKTTEEYIQLQSLLESKTKEYDNLSKAAADNREKVKVAEGDLKKLQDEFDAYKKRMEPYEELSLAEAEAKKAEAERIKAEKDAADKAAAEAAAAEKAAKEAAEKAAKEEEERIGYETGLTYQDIARSPDDHIGKKVKFTGKVVQLIEGEKENELRFAINDNYDQIIYLGYDKTIVSQRVLEDDWLTIYGKSLGTISYQSTMGGTITIPAVYVEKIDFE